MDKKWIISQNYLTVDLISLTFHIKNIPTFILFFVFYSFSDLFVAIIPALAYFFLMSSLFPPTIMEKDKTIYRYLITILDKRFERLLNLIDELYFKFMNF